MQKRTMVSGVLVTFMALSVLAGCQNAPAPQKPAEEVIKEGMSKLDTVKSYKFELALKGDVKDSSGPAGVVDVSLSGAVDGQDVKDPKAQLKLDGSFSDGTGAGADLMAEAMMNKANLYFNVGKVNLKGEGVPELPTEITSLFGKWYNVPLPEDAVTVDAEASVMTPEMLEMKQLLEDEKVLSQPQYVNTESVMGEASYHYSVTVDKAALPRFMKKVAEKQGESVSDADMTQFEEALKSLDMKGDVWVGSQSGVMNQVTLTLDLKASEATENTSGKFTFRLTLGDLNKAVMLTIPEGVQPFPMESLAGLLGPAMMAPGMMDESMLLDAEGAASFDDSMMMDLSSEELDAMMNSDVSPEDLESMMESIGQ